MELAFEGLLKVKVVLENAQGKELYHWYLPRMARWPEKLHVTVDLEKLTVS
jgi:hypothetical protein